MTTSLCFKLPSWKVWFFILFSFSFSSIYAQNCDNLTDGGTITGDESGCNSPTFDPSPITNTAAASGGSGAIEYIWMKTTGDPNSPFNTWQIIPGATGVSHDPTPITATTYYGRCSRRTGCTEYIGETNFVVKAISCCAMDIAINPTNSTLCPKEPLVLSVTGNGTGFSYAWEATGGNFDDPNAASPTYTMMMPGIYTIKVTITKDDCMEMAETTVTVANQSMVTISADHTYIEIDQDLQLNNSLAGTNTTFLWSASSGTFNNNVLANPTYSAATAGDFQIYLTATDQNGCTAIDTFDIGVGVCDFTISGVATNASCIGNDGAILITPNGAEGAITYVWSDPTFGNANNPTNIAAGTYSVSATDGEGCSATTTVVVGTTTDGLTLSPNIKLPACVGDNDGQILITVTGGAPTYTFNWSNGLPDSAFVNNLTAGTYALTVTDANGCQATGSYTVDPPLSLTLTTSATDPDCGLTNGTATITVNSGTPNYTYAWNDPANQTTAIANNLAGGTYQVIVTDANGCQATANVTLNNAPASNISVTSTTTNATCNRSNGSIDLTVTGGIAPLTYSWDNNIANIEDPTNIPAGVYTVIITDSTGCSGTTTAVVGEIGAINVSIERTNISCNGGSDGVAIASTSGGSGTYTYAWSNGLDNNATQTGLAAGTYTVTATDTTGCEGVASVTLLAPELLNAIITPTSTDCTNPNGSAIVNVTGGTAGYTYQWNDTNNQTTQSAVNLAPGDYMVVVTDANGCTDTATTTINANMGLVVTLSATPTLCNGENSGTITSNVTNGTAPYTYTWNNFLPNFPGFTGLAQGVYEVTVTDANGCFGTASAKVHSADSLLVTPVVEDASCDANDGRARLDVTGGAPDYSYAWGAPLNVFTAVVNNLAPGNYSYTVTDANGCSKSDVIIVGRPDSCDTICTVTPGVISTTDSTTICAGDGNPDPITVMLSGNTGQNTQWMITDAAGIILELPDTNVFDFEGAGIGTCLIRTVTYDSIIGLMIGQNTTNLSGCLALSNSITVIRNDCTPDTCMVDGGIITTTDSTTICVGDGNPDPITITVASNVGPNNQWIVTDPAGIIIQLPNSNVFDFENTSVGTCLIWNASYKEPITGLIVGQNAANLGGCIDLSNSITVIRNDCTPMDSCLVKGGAITTTDSTTICAGDSIPDPITVAIAGNMGQNSQWLITDEALNILELPDTNIFDFEGAGIGTCLIWSVSYDSIVGLSVGQNAANLTGCLELSNFIRVVRNDCTPVDTCTVTPSTISTTDLTNICVGDGNSDSIRVNLSVGNGEFARFVITDTALTIIEVSSETAYDFENTNPGICLLWNVTYAQGLTGLTVGSKINNLDGCHKLSNVITVIRQDCRPDTCLNFNVKINNPAGNNICSKAAVTLSTTQTGTGITYNWIASGGAFDDSKSATPTYTMMMPGTYEIIVTATKGECVAMDTTTVTILSGPEITLTTSGIPCVAGNNGAIDVAVSGGTAPFTYNWSDTNIGNEANPDSLSAGTYNLTVTDANGCTDTGSATINDGASLTVILTTTNPVCGGEHTGSISAAASGGTIPYTYNWSNGDTTTAINNLTAGTYSLTVTDANGCTGSDTTIIIDPTNFDVTIISTPRDICPGGSVNFGVTPADTTFTYIWTATGGSFDDSTSASPTYTMMMPGTYEIIVTASNGTCVDIDTTSVTILEGPFLASITITDVSCAGDSTGVIDVSVTSSNLPITYTWDSGIGNVEDPTGLPAGTYNATITDASGCSLPVAATVGENTNLTLSLAATNLNCNGANNGSITATVTGGIGAITYTWSNGAGNMETINNLPAGTYSVVATDSLGCSKEATTTLTAPNPIAVNITSSAEGTTICPGTTVNLTASPIDSNLTYAWTTNGGSFNDSTSATPVYTMMMAGTYEIILTVSNSTCSASDTTTVTIGTGVDATVTHTDVTCAGESDGSISVTVNSGAAPITYTWDNGIGNIPNPTDLAAGTYHLTISDANNCQQIDSVVIENANAIAIGLIATNISCVSENDGKIDLLAFGGANPLSFAWSNGEIDALSIDSLAPGTYQVTVTDNNGCTAVDSVAITVPNALTAIAEGANVGCNESGHAHVTATGGIAPYTYAWNDAASQTTDTAFNLVAGVYTVTITDNNGCTITESVSIIETSDITCSIYVLNDITTFNGSEGRLGVNVSGGSGNYTYSWNNGGMDSVINDLSTNTYIVTITDETGCTCTDTMTLLNPAFLGDLVFEDTDSNGLQALGEPGLEGVTLQLTGTTYYGTMIVRNTTTDINGNYQFSVPPGDYKVTLIDAFGYAITMQNTGADDAIDSDFSPATGMSQIVTLAANAADSTIDLGIVVTDECKNVLLGGSVKMNETICGPNADPSIITNVSFPSGGTGQFEYLWLKSDITSEYYPGHPDWMEIPNSNSPDYDPGIITKTTYYIRCSRRRGCNSYPGESNIITKTVITCLTNPVAENLRTTVTEGSVALTWEGTIPFKYGNFIIERSIDGQRFAVVDKVESTLSEEMETFEFTDERPNFGENFYRIKTFAPTINSNFSNIAMADVKPESIQKVLVYPNPVHDEVTIHFMEELKEKASIQIVNTYGQVMKSLKMDTSVKRQQVDISDLPEGIYYLKFDNQALKRLGQKVYKIEE